MAASFSNAAGRRRRTFASGIVVVALAATVAWVIKRAPPSFAAAPIATVRDASQGRQALWAIRVAAHAHELAADALAGVPAPPAGRAYQLWLQTPDGPRTLGLLPTTGRKVIPEIPAIAARLAGSGELLVSLEPARGSIAPGPSGPVLFRAAFPVGGG